MKKFFLFVVALVGTLLAHAQQTEAVTATLQNGANQRYIMALMPLRRHLPMLRMAVSSRCRLAHLTFLTT